jgi:hypothetical protein
MPVPKAEPVAEPEPVTEVRQSNAARHPDTPYTHERGLMDAEGIPRASVLKMKVSGILLHVTGPDHWRTVAPNGNEGEVVWDEPLNRCTANGRPYSSMREATYAAVGYGPNGEPPKRRPSGVPLLSLAARQLGAGPRLGRVRAGQPS